VNYIFGSRYFIVMFSAVVSMTGLSAFAAADAAFPDFNLDYWKQQQDKAHGKIVRGAVLGPTGLAIAAPTVILALKATNNPEQYAAYSIATGIAALGMTFHGFFSIASGIRGRDKADYFVEQYKNGPSPALRAKEREYYIQMQKKSAGKMVLFGMVLDVQAALLLADGIVLSVRRNNDELSDSIKIWPSYLIGGILFAGGTALAILKARRYFALDKLGSGQAVQKSEVSFAPLLQVDPVTYTIQVGLFSQISF
jgi:hypothetical protein